MAEKKVEYSDARSHPLYKKLSAINSQVVRLRSDQVRDKLKELFLNDRGSDTIVCKRYKQQLRRTIIESDPSPPPELARHLTTNPLGLHYLLIIDFEATCEAVNPPDYIHEIIEFPVLLFNMKTKEIEDEFHSYCKPRLNQRLSDFCVHLTGIQQSQVDVAPHFRQVFQLFTDWMEQKRLGSEYNFSLLTDCPWDIRNCLFPQCALAGVTFPNYASKWIDIRKLFSNFYQTHGGNLSYMLTELGMEFEGREHCGLDDAKNIARIMSQLLSDGCVLQYNRFISKDIIDGVFKKKR